jgi:hypothetical protein
MAGKRKNKEFFGNSLDIDAASSDILDVKRGIFDERRTV